MKSAKIIKPTEPLTIENIDDTPSIKNNNQVLIRIDSAGICHSDLHLWEGGYHGAGGSFMKVEDRGVKFPLTPGHEIAGTIEKIDENVSQFTKGDKVLVYPWLGEGTCPACRVGEENLCDYPKTLGIYQDGGYSDHVLVPSFKYLIKIDGIDSDSSASLACSGLTAYTAVKKASPSPGENLVIIGAGGLGLMAVQISKSITNANVIMVDVDDKKLSESKRLGVDHTINSLTTDVIKGIKDITNGNGAEVVIDFVNNSKTAPRVLDMLRKRGKYVMVGLFGGELNLSLPTVPLRAFNISGAYTGKFSDLVELVELSKLGRIQSLVSKKYQLDDVNEALSDLKNGKIIGRAVFNP